MTIIAPPEPPVFKPCYFITRRPLRRQIQSNTVIFEQHGEHYCYQTKQPRIAAQLRSFIKSQLFGLSEITEAEYTKIITPIPEPVAPAPKDPPLTSTPVQAPPAESPLTVVITNFKRPAQLMEAFDSCQKAKIKNIVIASSGLNHELEEAHNRIKDRNFGVKINAIEGDRGCNEMWLRGVQMVTTPWVHILHDDDMILPTIHQAIPALSDPNGFVHFPGKKHQCGKGPISGVHSPFGNEHSGPKPTKVLYKRLLRNGGLSISPVAGIFRRNDLLEILTECERIKDRFELRPGMMIGNDLLIWLRCSEKYEQFYYYAEPMISYGHWEGSTTCDDLYNHRNKLAPLYNSMRTYFLANPPKPVMTDYGRAPQFPVAGISADPPKIIHCVEIHPDTSEEVIIRKSWTLKSWQKLYERGDVFPAHYTVYQRDSRIVGDDRGLPFLKDVLAWGIQFANEQDLVMLTNDDTVLHKELPAKLFQTLSKQGATCSHRSEYRQKNPPNPEGKELFRSATNHPGRDLFAFTIPWLRQNWDALPDYLLGAPCWDIALAMMIRVTQGVNEIRTGNNKQCWEMELPLGYVAHIMHIPQWAHVHRHKPANGWNNSLAKAQCIRLRPGRNWEEIQRL